MLYVALRSEKPPNFDRLKGNSFANVDPKVALDVYLQAFNVAVFVMNP